MAPRNLATEAMCANSSPWVKARSAAQIVPQSSPLLAGLQPKLSEIHDAIADVRPVDASTDQALREAASELDFTHDVPVRALHGTLIAMAELTGDDVFAELAGLMFPRGLATIQLSHLEQVGHAELVRERLSAEQRELLDQIVVRGKHLTIRIRWRGSSFCVGARSRYPKEREYTTRLLRVTARDAPGVSRVVLHDIDFGRPLPRR